MGEISDAYGSHFQRVVRSLKTLRLQFYHRADPGICSLHPSQLTMSHIVHSLKEGCESLSSTCMIAELAFDIVSVIYSDPIGFSCIQSRLRDVCLQNVSTIEILPISTVLGKSSAMFLYALANVVVRRNVVDEADFLHDSSCKLIADMLLTATCLQFCASAFTCRVCVAE